MHTDLSAQVEETKADPLRIGTDHNIPQSPRWGQSTCFLGPQKFPGHLGALLHAIRVAFSWRAYDVVISANIRHAVCYCLVKRLLPFRAPRILVLEARLDDPSTSLGWKTKRALQRFAMQTVDLICVSARREITIYSQRLNLPETRFKFVPWHTNVLVPEKISSNQGYIFSAGRTGRDWPTFLDAVRGLPWKVVIVCGSKSIADEALPPNVELHTDIPYTEYRRLLEGARLVVLALEEHVYSSGQVAILEAMALGKPVIATDVIGTEDYIRNEENGLLVQPNSVGSMRNAIVQVMTDKATEEKLGQAGLETTIQHHMLNTYVETVLGLANFPHERAKPDVTTT